MPRLRLRFLLAVAAAAISLTLLAWSMWPNSHVIRRQFLQPTQMQLPTPG